MRRILIILALLALWPGYVHAQIVTDGITRDPGGGGGGLSSSDIDTLAELNAIISPDVLGTSSSQSITNKNIDCNGNTCKPLRGEDCTTFDSATGGQYCVDTDDLVIYFCSVGVEDPCDDPEEWVAISSASTMSGLDDVSLTDPQDGDMLSRDSGDWVNIVPPFLSNAGDLDNGEFCVYNSSGTVIDCNIPLGSLSDLNTLLSTAIQDTGTLTDANLCTYDETGTEIDCNTPTSTFQAAGTYATNSFTTMNAPSGTDPQADSATDTLNLTVNSPGIGISGDSSTDTLQFQIVYTNTLSGNATLGQNACVFSNEGNGGGFLCEGSTNDNIENLFLFPDLGSSDNTRTIALVPSSFSAGNCAEFDSNGQVVDSGGECGGGGGGSPLTVEESDDNPTVSDVTTIQFNASHFTVADETGGQVQVNSILAPLATALAANGSNCSAGSAPLGVDASGAAESCFDVIVPAEIDTFAELDAIVADEALVTEDNTQTLTNKTISGSSNTLSNIPWSALINVPAFRKTLFQLRPQANEPPASSFATMFTRNSHPGLSFDGDVCAMWTFVMPNWYGGNGVTVDLWIVSSETSNDTDWDGSWERIATSQDIDSDSFATAISADNNSNNATSGIATKVSIAFTDGAQMDSCTADELCRFRVCRDATSDTGGTTNGQAVLIGGQIRETP